MLVLAESSEEEGEAQEHWRSPCQAKACHCLWKARELDWQASEGQQWCRNHHPSPINPSCQHHSLLVAAVVEALLLFFSATGGLVAAGAGLAEVGVAELLDPSRPLNKAAAILCFSDITPDSCLAGAPPKEGFEG